jgi:hypothetical protein
MLSQHNLHTVGHNFLILLLAAYGINGSLNSSFIVGIQEVFSSLMKLGSEFNGKFDLSLNEPSQVSRAAATMHIMYYQVQKETY